jgi:hypothetical protein
MPGPDGKLTQEDIAKVQAWMRGYKMGHHPCPICDDTQWTIGEYLVHPNTQGNVPIFQPLPIYPNVILLSPCGYTRNVNAVMIGLASVYRKP